MAAGSLPAAARRTHGPVAMHLLFFAEQSPYERRRVGGAENSMRLIAEGLAARGHAVTFASLRPDGRPGIRRFAAAGVEVLLVPNPRRAPLRRVAARLGLGARRPGPRAWARVGARIFGPKGPKAEVLYLFYELEVLAEALRARDGVRDGIRDGARPGMAVVLRMAGLGWADALARDGGKPGAALDLFGAVDAINYLSPRSQALVEAKAAALGRPLRPASSFVADIGVDVGRVPMTWAGPSAGDGLGIVVATRFAAPQKRQDLLIEAVGLLRDRLPLRVTMIGDGGAREACAARVAALGLDGRIAIRPFMAQVELWETMRGADLLCHPCEHEGVSKIILEAMMLGLPVLASDVEPLPEYVVEGETGYRAANTPEAWAARLVEIAAAKDRLRPLSARARAFVEATYDTSRNVARYEAAFQALADARRGEAELPGAAGGTGVETGTGHAQ
jgi:glycosyltransferase involved in cell wall biosynthesis